MLRREPIRQGRATRPTTLTLWIRTMDIYVNGPGATDCVGSIFGPNHKNGPARRAPAVLAQFLENWPGHVNDFVRLALSPPPLCPVSGFEIVMHRCRIIAGGKLIGHALRMDDISLSSLAGWEAAWRSHRLAHAR